MENAKKSIQDKDISQLFDFVFQNAFGNPIIFTSAPTLAQMKPNSWGKYSTNLYIKFGNNTGLAISGTAMA